MKGSTLVENNRCIESRDKFEVSDATPVTRNHSCESVSKFALSVVQTFFDHSKSMTVASHGRWHISVDCIVEKKLYQPIVLEVNVTDPQSACPCRGKVGHKHPIRLPSKNGIRHHPDVDRYTHRESKTTVST